MWMHFASSTHRHLICLEVTKTNLKTKLMFFTFHKFISCIPEYFILHINFSILISYCIITTKYWLRAIFKENDLASSPLILQKANILWYWLNNCFIGWLKFLVTVRNDSVSRRSSYVARQMFFCCKQCRMVLRRLFLSIKTKVSVFLVLWISLTACNIAKYCTLAPHWFIWQYILAIR